MYWIFQSQCSLKYISIATSVFIDSCFHWNVPLSKSMDVHFMNDKCSTSCFLDVESSTNCQLSLSFRSIQSCFFLLMDFPELWALLALMLICFSTTIKLFTHSVGSLVGSRTLILISLLTSLWSASCIFCGMCWAGMESGIKSEFVWLTWKFS